jgi:hypothetical protein
MLTYVDQKFKIKDQSFRTLIIGTGNFCLMLVSLSKA